MQLIKRSEKEVIEKVQELFDELWYDRYEVTKDEIEYGSTQVDPEIWNRALAKARKLNEERGLKELDDCQYCTVYGIYYSLMWFLGEVEWDKEMPRIEIDTNLP